ncbi:hypothetical protein [Streptomyces triticisoli]|uniref:hypothetical protein n=1 Tax=Streptomyces triticisoli TaxID=2182797 RepID=UPI0013003B31|nr:hypothetical protein [Streptomyces triticisoli]
MGTSIEQLRDLGLQHAQEGYSVVIGFETSRETPRDRTTRVRNRSTKKRPKVNSYSLTASQESLFDIPES